MVAGGEQAELSVPRVRLAQHSLQADAALHAGAAGARRQPLVAQRALCQVLLPRPGVGGVECVLVAVLHVGVGVGGGRRAGWE